jgi:diguanylate cyclase (GGDEF)-like protein
MANDSFVKNWLSHEKKEEIIEYLEGIKNKYAYDSTFLISSDSLSYYHYNGLFKEINKENSHDVWYFDFISSDKIYDLDIDQDEVDNHLLTMFVNCKIFDEDEKVIGVTGVGIKVDYIQRIIDEFEQNYNLEAFLIDSEGIVQVHTNGGQIERRNIFNEALYGEFRQIILNENDHLNVCSESKQNMSDFVISYYIKDFDWYLVVRKDTSVLNNTFKRQMIYEFLVFFLVTGIVLFIVLKLISYHEKQMIAISHIDELTGLYNRRGFDIRLKQLVNSMEENRFCVFLFDIDNFKNVNDKYGHLQGDKVLKRIVTIFNREIKESIFARWGGDEFSGVLFKDLEESQKLFESLRNKIEENQQLKEFGVTLSIGIVSYSDIDTEESLIKKVDRAMYKAKSDGKNRVCV